MTAVPDWAFILNALRTAKNDYMEKASKYCYADHGKEYRENIYLPTLKQFDNAIEQLTNIKKFGFPTKIDLRTKVRCYGELRDKYGKKQNELPDL